MEIISLINVCLICGELERDGKLCYWCI